MFRPRLVAHIYGEPISFLAGLPELTACWTGTWNLLFKPGRYLCVYRFPPSFTLTDYNTPQCCKCTMDSRNVTSHAFCIRTLSVKDDHHKYRLVYWHGLPLVLRAGKLDREKE